MQSKKGQAAIEYLMTYGWAILVIVAVIAILIGSGLFSSKSFSTSSAISPPQLGINKFLVSGNTNSPALWVNISNNFGYTIKLVRVNATFRESSVSVPVGEIIRQGNSMLLKFDLKNMKPYPASGTTAKIDLRFEYINCYDAVNLDCGSESAEFRHTIPAYVVGYVE